MVKLINPHTKEYIFCKIGFSWTLFFGTGLVPLYRGEVGFFWKYVLLSWVTLGIYNIIQWFIYNKGYIQRKINQGWLPASERDKEILLSQGVYSDCIYEGEEITKPFIPNRIWFYILLGFSICIWFLNIAAVIIEASSY